MNPFLGSADGIIYNPWCRSSPAPLSRLVGEVDALSAELMMTFSLPIFPRTPSVFHGAAGDVPPSPGKSECSCCRLWGSPGRGRDAIPCTSGSLRLRLPASLAPGVLCRGPQLWMDKGKAPISDATHVSVSLAPELILDETSQWLCKTHPQPRPRVLASLRGFCRLHRFHPSLLEKKNIALTGAF